MKVSFGYFVVYSFRTFLTLSMENTVVNIMNLE